MRKPRALRPGDRVAVVAPASPFKRDEFDAGLAEIRSLGFEPVYDDSVFARHGYVAGAADVRAAAFSAGVGGSRRSPRSSPPGADTAASRCCRCSTATRSARHAKAFIGYSDNTSILSWLTLQCGIVSFHGPMIEGRLARGEAGLRPRHVRPLPVPGRGGRRDHASAPRSRRAGRGERHAARRNADAAHGVARHAVRLRIRRRGSCSSSTKWASAPFASTAC